jgi:creatinine amidohydrolase
MKTWRESHYPGGCAHSGEAETSLALHLDADLIQMDKAKREDIAYHRHDSKLQWTDLWGAGPVGIVSWTSEYTESGICGEAQLATPEKGRMLFEEAVKNLITFADEWVNRPRDPRKDHHAVKPLAQLPG